MFTTVLPAVVLADIVPIESSFKSRIASHPAVITISLRKAIHNLMKDPALLLHIGLKPIKSDFNRQVRVLQYIFSKSKVSSISFHGYDRKSISEGFLSGITVIIEDITMKPLSFEKLAITFNNLSFDPELLINKGKLLLKGMDSFSFETQVSEKALNNLVYKFGNIQVFEDEFRIYAPVKFLMFYVTARVCGNLYIKDETAIHFEIRSLNVGNLPFVDLFKNQVTAKVNPVFSFSRYLGKAQQVIDVKLNGIDLREGSLIVSGNGTMDL